MKQDLMWTTLKEVKGENYRIFKVNTMTREASNGEIKGDFFVVDAPDWIIAIPVIINDEGEECFLMVRQYRHGSDCITLEFPAGMVDPGEDPVETAKRELLEETGYCCNKIQELGVLNPNPAFMNNRSYTYLAEDLTYVTRQQLDEHELIEWEIVPQAWVEKNIGKGELCSGMVAQAYMWYKLYKEKNGTRK